MENNRVLSIWSSLWKGDQVRKTSLAHQWLRNSQKIESKVQVRRGLADGAFQVKPNQYQIKICLKRLLSTQTF